MAARTRAAEAYRRSPHAVMYWAADRFIVQHRLSGRTLDATPEVALLLGFFGEWRTVAEVRAAWPSTRPATLTRAVAMLFRCGLLERRGEAAAPSMGRWDAWGAAAAFFHFSTKRDLESYRDAEAADVRLRRILDRDPRPPLFHDPRGRGSIALPAPERDGAFASILLARRSWRRFGPGRVTLAELSTLLGLTFGVQQHAVNEAGDELLLKTSPSGGALHPIEAYVLALGVEGLGRGLYHYNAGRHRLAVIRRGASKAHVLRYIPAQWWFEPAAAIVFMTAVFERTQWKYRFPRAYRLVLLEAGHFCQTFCLAATALGLAPFCTQALHDRHIERDLGLDGVRESVVYAAGVGRRPPGSTFAPWPEHAPGHPYRRPVRARRSARGT